MCTEEAQSCFCFLSTLDRQFNSSSISLIQLLRHIYAIWKSILLQAETVELVCVLKKRRAVFIFYQHWIDYLIPPPYQ